MKRFFVAAALVASCAAAWAGADDFVFTQRNSTDSGNLPKVPAHPATPGVFMYDSAGLAGIWAPLGTGLGLSSGVLVLTNPPVNADWNSVSGLSQILNKPSIPAAQINSDWNAVSGLAQILNKPTIPAAQVNADWAAVSGVAQILNKPTIPSPYTLTVGAPTARTVALATAYQCTDNTKACIVNLTLDSTAALSLAGGTTITGEVRVGSTTAVATGTGSLMFSYRNSLTGTLVVGLAVNTGASSGTTILVPPGYYFAVRATAGTLTVTAATDQVLN